jgi:flagellar biosynthesis protein
MKKEERRAAVALRYDHDVDSAPVVIATGYGELAERIIREAVQHGIPLHEDAQLASLLVGLNLKQEIPAELYRAVAAVLALVFEADSIS